MFGVCQSLKKYFESKRIDDLIVEQYQRASTSRVIDLLNAGASSTEWRKRTVYRLVVEIDNSFDLITFDGELFDKLVNEPLSSSFILRQTVHSILGDRLQPPPAISLDQIYVVLRIKSLPINPTTDVKRIADFSDDLNDAGMVTVIGVVVSLSQSKSYPWSAQYFCSNTECIEFSRNAIIRYHSRVGQCRSMVVDGRFMCDECGSVAVEDKTCRQTGRFVEAQILDRRFLNSKPSAVEGLTVIFRDELVGLVKLGKLYIIVGVPVYDLGRKTNVRKTIEANSVDIMNDVTICRNKFADRIGVLYENCRRSPYSFVLSMAYAFGSNVSPPGTFFRLKLLALMSLVLKNDDEKFHIVAYGREIETIWHLLDYARHFAVCSTKHGVSTNLMPFAIVSPDYDFIINAGLINVADSGICLINLDRLTSAERQKLTKTMELRQTTVELSQKACGTMGGLQNFALNCSIWACAEFKSDATDVVARYFGVVLNNEFRTSSADVWYQNEVMRSLSAKFCSDDSVPANEDVGLSDDEMHTFLNTVRSNDISVSDEAKQLLRAYYLSSRRLRDSNFPSSANETLMSFAIALGKLSLSNVVSIDIALLTIRLYEEFVSVRFDCSSQLGVSVVPHFYTDDVDEYIGVKNDSNMKKFEETLLNYVANFLHEE